ncbi:probable peptide/nitrate transporter At3g43790 isoform X2 [Telopea speciosissima]|uniref:probable peptide/nitrate transporter At3g43790 isoform X2 n=1 Tax=Telopea speciosissima TaxID=54955 RepID=UPI001CC48D61|nr:probable peptide/nitrate transporter At3g43790 isoform X2 [Telopea speciosissima]
MHKRVCHSGCCPSFGSAPYALIRDLHIAKRVEDIGFYAGFVGSSFMIGRALTSTLWGMAADRYGRKPIIMIGTFSVLIFNMLFGLSTNYSMALSTRFILGGFNCVLGSIRAYAAEICRDEYRALGQSVVSTSTSIGVIMGPAIGGYFAQPAEKFPHIFSKSSLFGRYPYFLPCLAISILSGCVFIACFWLPETLHMHSKENEQSNDAHEAPSYGSDEKEAIKETTEKESSSTDENLLKNWPLMSTIILYCVFSLHDFAFSEIFSLWAVSGKKYGGLSFTSQAVGQVHAISGFGILLFQFFVFPPEKSPGPIMVTRVSAILSIPLTQSFPFIAALSGLSLDLILNVVCIFKNALSVSIMTGLFILQNVAVPQHQRAAANGISMTLVSLFKAFGPAGGGVLFSWAQKRLDASFLPGEHLVFFVLTVITFIGVLMTFKPFLPPPREWKIFRGKVPTL